MKIEEDLPLEFLELATGEKSNFSVANEEPKAAIDDDRILRRSYLPGVKSALRVAKDDGDKRRSSEANK